eukprot:SAG31_NODE_1387_length_8554_cov_14.239148_1_plen_88_part_00
MATCVLVLLDAIPGSAGNRIGAEPDQPQRLRDRRAAAQLLGAVREVSGRDTLARWLFCQTRRHQWPPQQHAVHRQHLCHHAKGALQY